MEIDKDIKKVIKEKFNHLPEKVIEEIINFQFSFVRDRIKSGDNKPTLLHNLGTFKLKRSVEGNEEVLEALKKNTITDHTPETSKYKAYRKKKFLDTLNEYEDE